jgi:hypothetical protein
MTIDRDRLEYAAEQALCEFGYSLPPAQRQRPGTAESVGALLAGLQIVCRTECGSATLWGDSVAVMKRILAVETGPAA